jgi:glycosyltransferase involved in cell wall biosynthesis
MASISIITINYNNDKGLERTIKSVVDQTSTDFEYLIVDGGSTDTSVQIIKSHVDRIAWWVSEKDKGIYNAMNKGIERSTGEYLLFLNSGDFFNDEKVIADLHRAIAKYEHYKIIYGNIEFRDPTGHGQVYKFPEKLTLDYFLEHSIPHPSTLIHKSLFHEFGGYDESLKIVADWSFFFKVIILHSAEYKQIDRNVAVFITDGISSQSENNSLIAEERQQVIRSLLPPAMLEFIDKKNSFERYYHKYRIEKIDRLVKKTKNVLGIVSKKHTQ